MLMKAQGGMLEDVLMAMFILIIIVIAVFFIFGFQFGSSETEKASEKLKDAIFVSKFLMQSPLLSDDGILDDSKLANFISEQGCNDVKKIVDRKKICIQIEQISLSDEVLCIENNFDPECTKWEICELDCLEFEESRLVESPINIHRSLENKNELGLLRVKLPL